MRCRLYGVVLCLLMTACGPSSADGGDQSPNDGGAHADGAPASDAPLGRLTVNGTVVNRRSRPQGGAVVTIEGKAPITTGSDGSFSASDVAAPYNVLITIDGQTVAAYYVGLSTATPVLSTFASDPIESTATVTGSLTAGDSDFASPNPASTQTRLITTVEGGGHTHTFAAGTSPTPFDEEPDWDGTAPVDGTLHALQAVVDGSVHTDLVAYGSADIVGLAPDATLDLGEIVMADADEASVQGNLALGPNSNEARVTVYTVLPDGTRIGHGARNGQTSFNRVALDLPGAKGCVSASARVGNHATYGYQSVFALPASNVAMSLTESIPAPVSPGEGQDIGVGVVLNFSPVPGAIHLAFLAGPDYLLWVITTDNQVRIPDLSEQGIPMSAGTYSWFNYALLNFSLDQSQLALRGLFDTCSVEKMFYAVSTIRSLQVP